MINNYANNLWFPISGGSLFGRKMMMFFGVLSILFLSSVEAVGQATVTPSYAWLNGVGTATVSVTALNTEDIIISVATDPQGNVYSLSFGNGVSKRSATGAMINSQFIPANQLDNPLDLAIDKEGYIYIADFLSGGETFTDNGKIRVFDPTGQVLPNRTILTSFYRPLGLDVNSDKVYVAEFNDAKQGPEQNQVLSRIRIYDKFNGDILNESNQVEVPFRIAVDSKETIYVSQAGDNDPAVFYFDSNLNYQGKLQNITSPGSVVVDEFDFIYVNEYANRVDFSEFINFNNLGPSDILRISGDIKKGIDREEFIIKIFDPQKTYKIFIIDKIDFPVDLIINSCDKMYVNNSNISGFSVFGTFFPTEIKFDLEIYQRTPSMDKAEAPVILCPLDITKDANPGENFAIVTYIPATATDNCSTNVIRTQGLASGSQFPIGSSVVEYTATDGAGNSSVCSFTVTVNAVAASNNKPLGNNDSYSTNQDIALSVSAPGVLGNDADADSDTLTAIIQSSTSDGTLILNADGSFTYTPNSGFFGDDNFTYVANDGTENSNVATVTITVNEVVIPNTAPVANNDTSYSTNQDIALSVSAPGILGNDADADGDTLTAIIQSSTSDGTLILNADGSFTYTPNSGFFGDDNFTYVANDGTENSNVATVTITVNEVVIPNTAPVANNDTSYSTNQDIALSVSAPGILGNDADADGDTLTAIIQSSTSDGTLILNADGSFTYTPNSGFFGDDNFTYVANDGTENSNVATVTITVNEVVIPNTAPVANNDTSYSTNQDIALSVSAPGVLGNDTDADGDTLTAIIQSSTSDGTLVLNADGSFTYTPNSGFFGDDSFTYVANDGTENSNVATVTITVNEVVIPNTAPVANNDTSYSTNQDIALSVSAPGVLGNDTDADGDTLTAIIQSSTSDGTLVLNADGSFTYTPNSGFFGDDSFTYVANDGTENSNVATVAITVNEVVIPNTAPVANNDTSYSTNQDIALSVSAPGVLGNDTDADGDTLTAIIQSSTSDGTLVLNADGSFTYTPNFGFFGDDSFTYVANDGTENSNVATVTITVNEVVIPNTTPVANNDTYSTNQDATFTIGGLGVLENDTDADGDALTAILQNSTSHGVLTLNSDGSFTYVPDSGYFGDDTFTYVANDGMVDSNVATVSITVKDTSLPNAAPEANNESYTTFQDVILQVATPGVLGNDTDADNDNLMARIQRESANGSIVLNSDGSFTYTPNSGFTGEDNFTYLANDGSEDSNVAEVTITVTPKTNTAPISRDDIYSTLQGESLTVSASSGVLSNDSDEEGDELIAVLISDVSSGTLTLNQDGSFVYVPNAGFSGNDTFTYAANDGNSNSNVATARIEVVAVTGGAVICKESMSLELDETGMASLDPGSLFVSRPSDLQFSVNQEIFTCDDLGENVVTLNYSNSEVQGSCEVLITINDATPPQVNIKDITFALNEFRFVRITPEMLDNGSSDNCEITMLSLDKESFGCKELGENVVTFTATDSSGNTTSATAIVTVTGNCELQPFPDVEYIFIYPNPTSGPFQFATPAGVTIQRVEAYDARGRMIMFKNFSEIDLQYAMDLFGVQQAVYILKLFTSEGLNIIRVIIN